ncbi:MAG: hypothetical protein QOG79_4670 [Mycobacterium sp.]|jgi:hypothetical protein|nr:hypothetical protein [Mycobacterium sp.]MDT5301428.1 hypothetical protein [Mycobacterium sp.]
MKRWNKLVAGVAIAGGLTAGAMGLGAGTASADPPPWAPGHGHDGGYGRDNDGRWNNDWNNNNGNWNNNNNGPWNDNGQWGNRPPPPFWAPTAQVFWDPTRQAWGFFWGPLWFPAY